MCRWLILMLACAVTMAGGCDEVKPIPTPAMEFMADQDGKTVTTHGAIVSGSAQDVPGKYGVVKYQTADGQWWTVQQLPDRKWGDLKPHQGDESP